MDVGAVIAVAAFVWGVLVWLAAQRRLSRVNGVATEANNKCANLQGRVSMLERDLQSCEQERGQYMRERDEYARQVARLITKGEK